MQQTYEIKCPTCKTPVIWNTAQFRPFCSERCRLIDLGNWASNAYRIPVSSTTTEVTDEKFPMSDD